VDPQRSLGLELTINRWRGDQCGIMGLSGATRTWPANPRKHEQMAAGLRKKS
jgi:hypothetical protein